MMMVKSMKKPILCAKYCSSEFLSAGLTRHVQAGNNIDDVDDFDHDGDDMMMMMMTSYFPTAESMFLYNASVTPMGQFE